MKKSKFFIIILTLFILATFGFVLLGCQPNPDGPDNPNDPTKPDPNDPNHVHEYTMYNFDENGHWKECACGVKEPGSDSDHHLGGWKVTKAANCTEEGVREQSCAECEYKKTDKINVNPNVHVWDTEHPITEVAPTCQTPGKGKYKCTLNPDHVSEDLELPIDPDAHNFGENWKVRTEPTCLEEGVEENPCQNPGCTEFATRLISKLDHQWNDTWYTDKYDAVPATCLHTGRKVRYCTRQCGTPEFQETPIDPTNHEYANTYTSIDNFEHSQAPSCGHEDAPVKVSRHDYTADGGGVGCKLCTFHGTSHDNGSTITYDEDNGVINIKRNSAEETLIIIPAIANGKPVTTLGPGEGSIKDDSGHETMSYGLFRDENKPFATNVLIKDIVIPYTISRAKENAFSILPNLLAEIGYIYFEGTPNQFDKLDFSASDWLNSNGTERKGWTRTLAFYSEKNPNTFTAEDKQKIGFVDSVHRYFYTQTTSKQLDKFTYRFWHWVQKDDKWVPEMWDYNGGAAVDGTEDTEKGKHATEGLSLTFEQVKPSLTERRILGLKITAASGFSNGTLVLPKTGTSRDSEQNMEGVAPIIEIKSINLNSVTKLVIPDSVFTIGSGVFSGLQELYFEGNLDTWNKVATSNNSTISSLTSSGKIYIYSFTEPTQADKEKKWTKSADDNEANFVKYWHWVKGSDNTYEPKLWDDKTNS